MAGRPKSNKKIGSENSTEQRATFIIQKDLLSKIKSLAETESKRLSIEGIEVTVKLKSIVNKALEEYIDRHENK